MDLQLPHGTPGAVVAVLAQRQRIEITATGSRDARGAGGPSGLILRSFVE